MTRKYLASINGMAVYAGDLLFSTWHNRPFIAENVYVDSDDREVFLSFSGNGGGSVSAKSVAVYPKNSPHYVRVYDETKKADKVALKTLNGDEFFITSELHEKLKKLVYARTVIEAIKVLRLNTGVSLKEAKDMVQINYGY